MADKWISVHDRVPLSDRIVYVIVDAYPRPEVTLAYYRGGGLWDSALSYDEDGNRESLYDNVTHWRPLEWPQLPEGA